MKSSKVEAASLSKLFPSSPSLPKFESNFDPGGDCVFSAQKQKKKAARVKASKLTLTLLHGSAGTIPRGKHRKTLQTSERIQKVDFTREMSAQVVKNKIIAAFSGQKDFNSAYSLLTQSQDGRLSTADNQYPTGQQFVENALKHRGNVYLVPRKEVAQKKGTKVIDRWTRVLVFRF